ncbi:hypothetical protein FKP32DRAFT_1133207 [Trametes sanguinea]|nr:hypothetical protein FKP32DRAFT_1133207 [Trametes sanguinea]
MHANDVRPSSSSNSPVVLADRTAQVNTATTQARTLAARRKSCALPRWIEVESEGLPQKEDAAQEDPLICSQRPPRVRWATRERIFSWSEREDTPRPKQDKPLTPILRHQDRFKGKLSPLASSQAVGAPEDMRGRAVVKRELVNTPPSRVTVRSRSRSHALQIAPAPVREDPSLPGPVVSDMSRERVRAPGRVRRNAVYLDIRPTHATTPDASAVFSNWEVQPRSRPVVCMHTHEDDSELVIPVLVVPPTPPVPTGNLDETKAISPSAEERLYPSLTATSQATAEQPRRLNHIDQYLLRFGFAYTIFITLMFMPIIGLW